MKKFGIVFSLLLITSNIFAQTVTSQHHNFQIEKIIDTDDVIWGLDFYDNETILFTLRSGHLFKLQNGLKMPISGTPRVYTKGQGGLLDVKVKEIQGQKYIYLTYSKPINDGAVTALGRAKLNLKDNKLEEFTELFVSNANSDKTVHFGSRLVFKDDKIYMGIGERGLRDLSQDKTKHHGKIIRLNLNGTIPADNPHETDKTFAKEVWSLGHRNPQGIDIDQDGNIWNSEFGPRGGDEINLIKKGANYGWPIITYGSEYWGPKIGSTHKEGMEQPIKYWTPSISPSGLLIYKGSAFENWRSDFFLANLSSRHLRRVRIKENKVIEEEELLSELKERIRHVSANSKGHIFISTDSGRIYEIKPLENKIK
ncbi:glucose/sorbosone dehydrogenase [Bacteriovorax sp. BSW11_IV]|uniref:PQQ-dependent sugar dehydrogenase n=1 Tax=Bacteriovorax sp. BSW11_IV TaxID=1353529 RepID=UPI00038A152A|nr:PQQ-dependent sugar dehydrogenase [Bacteriovorax sp. BSW11_IV]EQC48485.1 glucose/sorbosone dehydrogenase [Bacteriovorax sp. BSW11_IV]